MFNSQFSIVIRKEKALEGLGEPAARLMILAANSKSRSSNWSDSAILSCIGGTFRNPTSTSDEN
jgi:hypothetical protein